MHIITIISCKWRATVAVCQYDLTTTKSLEHNGDNNAIIITKIRRKHEYYEIRYKRLKNIRLKSIYD